MHKTGPWHFRTHFFLNITCEIASLSHFLIPSKKSGMFVTFSYVKNHIWLFRYTNYGKTDLSPMHGSSWPFQKCGSNNITARIASVSHIQISLNAFSQFDSQLYPVQMIQHVQALSQTGSCAPPQNSHQTFSIKS